MTILLESDEDKIIEHIDAQILYVQSELEACTIDDDNYETTVKRLSELVKIREELNDTKRKNKFNWGPVISGGLGILSILMIMKYEETGIISTKGFGIATKLLGR